MKPTPEEQTDIFELLCSTEGEIDPPPSSALNIQKRVGMNSSEEMLPLWQMLYWIVSYMTDTSSTSFQ
jgi:hypothetical protein